MATKQYNLSLFIFRRDLRLEDNTGLMEALRQSDEVLPCFIFDPRQVKSNPYAGWPAIQFMIESLKDLNENLQNRGSRLYVFEGRAHEQTGKLLKEKKIDAVFVNRDYTPFSVQRDLGIKHECEKNHIQFHSCGDALLHEPEDVSKKDGGPYSVFTPFYRQAMTLKVRDPQKNNFKNFFSGTVRLHRTALLKEMMPDQPLKLLVKGGRTEGLKLLKTVENLKHYKDIRDIPSKHGTSRLSAHHKFGTVSIREVYHKVKELFGKDHTMIQELHWRDFFSHVGFHYPHVLGSAFQEKYENIPWRNNKDHFHAWCDGKTGFPIVDAGMRELNETGFMHNRVRMIVASFLVKDLHIDWRWGEKYFAQRLTDYDPLVNNGNWQWAASTGCDAQPYFRIFNPWRQQERFDPQCVYVKEWIPELETLQVKQMHGWEAATAPVNDYPLPIVDHKKQSSKAKEMYKRLV